MLMKTCLQLLFGFLLLILNIENVYAIDQLSAQSNDFLVQKIDSFQSNKNNPEVWKYINAYILKAKIRNDHETLFYGYKEAIYYSQDYSNKLKFADSAIVVAQQTRNNDYIVQSFLSKGLIHYQFKKFQPALKNYLLAENNLNKKSSNYLTQKVLFNLALIKFHLKQFNEAEILFQKCTIYFEKNSKDMNHQAYYLNSLYYFMQVLQAQHNFNVAHRLNQKGLKLSEEIQNDYFTHYFTYLKGTELYFEKNYQQSISILINELDFLKDQQDFNTLSLAYFYIGKSYEALNENQKSIEYFEKINSIFNQFGFLDSDVRSAYEALIDNSAKNNNYQNQLYYINQLLKLDHLTQQNIVKLSPILQKEYDEKELLKLKKNVEFKIIFYPILIGSVIILCSIVVFYGYKRFLKLPIIYKKKEKEQLNIEIPSEVVKDILNQLNDFELNKLFLEPTLTLAQLAKSFKTNSTYLSRIINTQKGTNFSNYINQLRINYLLNLLTNSDKFLQHSISDLAELGGFSSSRHFSNAFFQVTNLRPLDYIKQLKDEVNTDKLNNNEVL